MPDPTTTTAEAVLIEARLASYIRHHDEGSSIVVRTAEDAAKTALDALAAAGYVIVKRDDPEALADLMGGHYEQVDPMNPVPRIAYKVDGRYYDHNDRPFTPPPLFVFVPQEGANLGDANLGDADLAGADLYGANLSRADLSDADLYRANLSGADLTGANLAGADLADAYLSRADLSDANLSRANLSGADLYGAVANRYTTWPEGFDPAARGVTVR